MQPEGEGRSIVQFGPFQVDFEAGVLRKYGTKVKLQTQPFQILAALLDNPGTPVTRNELRQRLWAHDTFVDFEHGLNVAVTRLRQALGDSAEQPRYIETLAKRGYRFCATVEKVGRPDKLEMLPAAVAAPPITPPVSQPDARGRRILIYALLTALVFSGILVFRVALKQTTIRAGVRAGKRAVPLTAFRGTEADPALSPDGALVAFTWNGENQDNIDVYVMSLDSGSPRRLTMAPAADVSPAWSPDGRTIAFVRKLGEDRGDLLVVPATGGPEHKVCELRNHELMWPHERTVSLSWSPDGGWIAASHREPGDFAESIYLFSPTGDSRKITDKPGAFGDHTPAFSPDGRTLAFSRLDGFSAGEIYTAPLNAKYQRAGEARRLTAHKRWSVDPVWLPDGRRILYVTAEYPDSRNELRMIGASNGEALAVPVALEDGAARITAGKHLVYSQIRQDTNIWRARIPRPGEPPSQPELFLSSTRVDEKPKFSPDGKEISFTSSRSGSPEIWVAKADGSSPVQLTTFGGPLMGQAYWSPDGQWLVFHARPEGQADLFTIASAGGPAKRLTADPADETMPSYSHDGRWIYFTSTRSGQWEVWRMPVSGGAAVQLTNTGGLRPFESPDGKSVFYLTVDGTAIRSVPAGGGPSTLVVAPVQQYPNGFTVTSQGIYYPAPLPSGGPGVVMFMSFSTGARRSVALAHHPFGLGMTVSPDDRYILFDQFDQFEGDLLVVKDFLSLFSDSQ